MPTSARLCGAGSTYSFVSITHTPPGFATT